FGGGPGLYFDFVELSFHVPRNGLSAENSAVEIIQTATEAYRSRIWNLLIERSIAHGAIYSYVAALPNLTTRDDDTRSLKNWRCAVCCHDPGLLRQDASR